VIYHPLHKTRISRAREKKNKGNGGQWRLEQYERGRKRKRESPFPFSRFRSRPGGKKKKKGEGRLYPTFFTKKDARRKKEIKPPLSLRRGIQKKKKEKRKGFHRALTFRTSRTPATTEKKKERVPSVRGSRARGKGEGGGEGGGLQHALPIAWLLKKGKEGKGRTKSFYSCSDLSWENGGKKKRPEYQAKKRE